MYGRRVVLCAAASAYEQKFYLNPQFESLPEAVRVRNCRSCAYCIRKMWEAFSLYYDEEGNLELKVERRK